MDQFEVDVRLVLRADRANSKSVDAEDIAQIVGTAINQHFAPPRFVVACESVEIDGETFEILPSE